MSHHDIAIPLSVFDPNAADGAEIDVSFDYEAGAVEPFYIVSSDAHRGEDGRIITWLDENWPRPDA